MKLLLDTNVMLWWLADDVRLGALRVVIQDSGNEVFFSSVSCAEISIKTSLGRLGVPDSYVGHLEAGGIAELAFTAAHGQALATLPWHHKDPFDRMIIAQSLVEGWPVATGDRAFAQYGVRVLGQRPG